MHSQPTPESIEKHYAGTALTALIVATVLHGMIHGYSIFLSPLNEQMRRFFAADTITAITAMKTTYLVVYAMGNLFFGALTNRLSARHTLAAGMVVNGLAVAAFSRVHSDGIVHMHILWTLAALGGSVYHPIANVLITRLYPNRKGMVLGVTGMGAAVGFAFAPLLTSFLSGVLQLTWQPIALSFGSAGVVVGVLAWFFVPQIARSHGGSRTTAAAGSQEVPATTGPAAATTPEPSLGGSATPPVSIAVLSAVIGVACLREMTTWSVLDISDFFLTAVLTDSTRTGLFLFLLYLPGIFVKPVVGVLSDRIGRQRLTSSTMLLYGVATAAVAVVGPAGLAPLYLLMGLGQAATVPLVEAIVADSTSEENRGIVFGAFVTVITGCGALGPLVSGIALDALGGTAQAFRLWMVVLGALPIFGAFILGALRFPARVDAAPQRQDAGSLN